MKNNINSIVFELTQNCNLNCRYCYNIHKIDEKFIISNNSYSLAKKTLKKIFDIANIDYVTFTGGEPTLGERFLELVLFAKMKKKSVTVITNGNNLTDGDYKILVDLKVDLFEIPFHSTNPEIHDYLTRVNGSHQKALNSIKKLIELNANVVAVIVLTKVNCKDVGKTLKYLKELNIKHIMLNRFNIGGEGIKEQTTILPSFIELNEGYKKANEIIPELNLSVSSNVCTPVCVINPQNYKNILFSHCASDIKEMPITLDIEGNIRFCNHSPVNLGNIYKNSLDEIFSNDYVKQWETTIPVECENCNLYSVCKGGCKAASEQSGLGLNHADPLINLK